MQVLSWYYLIKAQGGIHAISTSVATISDSMSVTQTILVANAITEMILAYTSSTLQISNAVIICLKAICHSHSRLIDKEDILPVSICNIALALLFRDLSKGNMLTWIEC